MKRNTLFLTIISIFLITIGSVIFMKTENDHKECSQKIEFSIGKNGEKIKTERHICKEKFNF